MGGLLFISWQISLLFSGVVAAWDELKQLFIMVSVNIYYERSTYEIYLPFISKRKTWRKLRIKNDTQSSEKKNK